MRGRKLTQQFLPELFALYMATSASCRRFSAVPSDVVAMPMLALTRYSRPPRVNGGRNTSCTLGQQLRGVCQCSVLHEDDEPGGDAVVVLVENGTLADASELLARGACRTCRAHRSPSAAAVPGQREHRRRDHV